MSVLTRRRFFLILLGLAAATATVMALALLFGAEPVDWSALSIHSFRDAAAGLSVGRDDAILFQLRLPRVLMAALIGAALSAAGVAFQGLLRNPLADPFILGVSGGGALGAVIAIVLGLATIGPLPATPFFAFLGSFLTVLAVFRLARAGGRTSAETLLLAGVVANAFLSAVILFVISVAKVTTAYGIISWMMGAVGYESWSMVALVAAYVLAGGVLLAGLGRDLNLLALGEDVARQTGVPVERTKALAFFAASLVTGAVVSVAGLIGFVGLIVPHFGRLLLGPDHRLLLPASMFLGAIFLVACDTLARTLIAPTEIPVGVVTALVGGPFFILLLRRRQVGGAS
jgi:iron complex transport system permease protein